MKPLTDFVSPKVKFVWSDDCDAAFKQLKLLLSSKPVLKSLDFTKPFLIQVDASESAAGAVLLQEGQDSILQPIYYSSSMFENYQERYSTIEKEAVNFLIALEKIHVYIDGKKTIVYSDHNPLRHVNSFKEKKNG